LLIDYGMPVGGKGDFSIDGLELGPAHLLPPELTLAGSNQACAGQEEAAEVATG
jgi:hypothetical protein